MGPALARWRVLRPMMTAVPKIGVKTHQCGARPGQPRLATARARDDLPS